MRFATRVLQDERHRRRLDGNATIPGQDMRVGITDLEIKGLGVIQDETFRDSYRCVRIPRQLMCLQHQSVHEGCLSVMQMASDGDVPNHGRVIHHLQHESATGQKISPIPSFFR
jgi:hypothetical protein